MGEATIKTANRIRESYSAGKASFRGPGNRAGMTQSLDWKTSLSGGFLQLLGCAEGNLLAGLDVDCFAGGGVAAHAGSTLAHLQDAETDDADALALFQVLCDPA